MAKYVSGARLSSCISYCICCLFGLDRFCPINGVQFAKLDGAAERKVEAYLKRFHELAARLPDLVSR